MGKIMKKIELSVVIPVYRSAENLERLAEVIFGQENLRDLQMELILVNDSSPDNAWEVIQGLCKKHKGLKALSLRRNFGQHSAVMAGLQAAAGEVLVTMDDDLQHDPAYIRELYEKIKAGNDVCYTNYVGRKHSWWKVAGSRFNGFVAGLLLGKPKDIYLSSFRGLSRPLVAELITYTGPYPYIDGLILAFTNRISTIDIVHQERYGGESGYSLYRCINLWLKMATNFSILPLRIAIFCGLFFALAAFVMIFFLIWLRIVHGVEVQGWTSLVVIILFLGGVQLCFMGLLGEYVGRAYLQSNRLPQFSVAESISALE
jgi:undecaprenyl-phosphate 4-deoxy-4-formamido-L-arabinose transferase